MDTIENKFLNIRTYLEAGLPALHKPLLVLFMLGRYYLSKERLVPFVLVDNALTQLFDSFYPAASERLNTHYPFGKLENDGLWEVEHSRILKRTSVGHLSKSELLEKNIHAGFTLDIYNTLIADKKRIINIANQLLQRYFPMEQHASLRAAVGLPQTLEGVRDMWDGNHAEPSMPTPPMNPAYPSQKDAVDSVHNGFIAYLNSLHNLGAGGANALAETQALNQYFAHLYEPFPIVGAVLSALRDGVNRVVVLTGHAGDGKSTVALDVFKHLRGLPPNDPLQQPLAERETTESPVGPVTIVKDMSELGAEIRMQWLADAFGQPGSWLIISNTGPLLDSLDKYVKQHGIAGDIESDLLAKMDETYAEGVLDAHTLHGFPKTLVIFNLTRLDNVALGARVLGKMLNHPAWADCAGCPADGSCPLQLNRRALLSLGVMAEDRVRWVYQRLTHYEQRLTLRQMLAHLALALTGGMDCRQAQRHVEDSTAEGTEKGVDGLAEIMFSEGFFGYRNGKPWDKALGLRAVALARRLVAGGPVAVDYERQLLRIGAEGVVWAGIPEPLVGLARCWGAKATNAAGVRWRFALRRMLYVFCLPNGQETSANLFFDTFLRSPKLREFDYWQGRQQ